MASFVILRRALLVGWSCPDGAKRLMSPSLEDEATDSRLMEKAGSAVYDVADIRSRHNAQSNAYHRVKARPRAEQICRHGQREI